LPVRRDKINALASGACWSTQVCCGGDIVLCEQRSGHYLNIGLPASWRHVLDTDINKVWRNLSAHDSYFFSRFYSSTVVRIAYAIFKLTELGKLALISESQTINSLFVVVGIL